MKSHSIKYAIVAVLLLTFIVASLVTRQPADSPVVDTPASESASAQPQATGTSSYVPSSQPHATGTSSYVPRSQPYSVEQPSQPVPQQVVIQFAPDTTQEERAAYVESVGGVVVENIESLDTVVVTLPEETAQEPLPQSAFVAQSEPDYYVYALGDIAPINDPRYIEQWALPAIGAPSAWAELPADAPKVIVAVIDSGICASHPDLAGRILDGWDFLESDATPQDDFGHGCSVAGVIAANMNDGIGIAGVAPNAQIMPLRVLNASGVGSYSDVAAAIVYAADHGAQVINLSLGGASPSTTLENAVNYAISKGVIVVAAAGNNGTEGALYPAAYPDVIAVGSVDPNLQHSNFSNYGSQIDIWAPGRDILTTKRDGGYGLVSGTSFAAPYVAGAEAFNEVVGHTLLTNGSMLSLIAPEGATAIPTPEVTSTPNSIFSRIIISDEKFVSGDPRGELEIQNLLENLNSDLTQTNLEPAEGLNTSASSAIAYLGEEHAISPSVLLTYSEIEYGLLSNIKKQSYNESDLSFWFRNTSKQLSTGFYEFYNGSPLPYFTLLNGDKVPANSSNASTYALRRYYANNFYGTKDEWNTYVTEMDQSFVKTYEQLFGVVTEGNLNAKHPSSTELNALALPTLYLPWENGKTWYYTGGPHNFDGSGNNPLSGVDFAPGGYSGCNPSIAVNEWIASSASGKTVDYQTNWLKLDHDQDGNVNTGWLTVYGHIANRIDNDVSVNSGARLGNPSCLGGTATGIHVHFGIKYQNVWQPIAGTVISGWTVQNGQVSYHGYMGKSGQTQRESCYRANGSSNCSSAALTSDNSGSGGGSTCYALTRAWTGSGNEPTASPANSSGCSSGQYKSGESISLTAHPASGWHLDHWSGTDSSSSSRLTMPSNSQLVKAYYVQDTTSCNPNADQVALFVDANYSGSCVVKGIGDYPNPGSLNIANDSLSSIKVGGNVKLTLCRDDNYTSTCEQFTGDDSNLSDNSIGDNQVSSAKVESRPTGGSCTNGATSGAIQPGYNSCASEGGTCTFSGQASVAYGANNCFFYQTFTSSVSCNNSTFGDPISGTGKTCSFKILTPAPSAGFDAWGLSGTAPFTSAMHIIDTSNITSCSWNYGDGQTGTSCASSHNHTYSSAGTFTVSLTVSGPGGSNSMTRTNYISVTASGDSYEPDDSSGSASLISSGSTQTHNIIPSTDVDWVKFQLTNPSAITLETTGPTGYDTRMWLYNSSMSQIDYSDDEGVDAYSLIDRQCGVDPLPAGTYYAKVDDYLNDNTVPSYNLSFNITQDCTPPSANFDAWGLSGNAPFTSAMHIVNTSYITSCSWNYGDGQTGTSCASLHDHIYNNAGTYTVSLTVSGPGGSDSMTRTNYITVSAIPRAPSNLTVTGTTNNSIALTWQDNSNNETGFKIYRWDYIGDVWEFYLYEQTGSNVNSYTNTQLSCGSDYYYQVSAYSAQGESDRAGWVKGTTADCPKSELIITSITFDPVSPFTNDDVWAKVIIQNTSSVPTSGFWIDYYVDDTPTECSDWGSYWGWSSGLAANTTQTRWVRLPANSLTTGAHQFRAYVDSECEIAETDENNNISSAAFTLTVPPVSPPAHDDIDAARLVSPIPYTNIVDVSGATTASDDPYVPNCDGEELDPGMTSVWYTYTPSANTSLYLDTLGSSYDTYIVVWSGERGALTQVGCNDDYDYSNDIFQSALEVQLTADTTYYFEVADYSDSTSVSSTAAALSEPAVVLPPGASSAESFPQKRQKSNDTDFLSKEKSVKPLDENSDVEAQAGGSLQFHVFSTLISPLKAGSFSSPGGTADFVLTVTNSGGMGVDTIDLTAATVWTVTFYAADGVTQLTDTDDDGKVDTGPLSQGSAVTITAKVAAPAGAVVGDANSATVTASSSLNTRKSATTLQSAVPASFVQIYEDDKNDATGSGLSLDLVQPDAQVVKKITPDGYYYDMSVTTAPNGNFIYIWRKYLNSGSVVTRWIEYTLLDHNGDTVRAVSKLTDYTGATANTSDYAPSVAVAPNGAIGVLWRHYLGDSSNHNDNIYFATLDASGNLLTGPTNLTNNTAWGITMSWPLEDTLNVPFYYSPTIAASDDNRFIIGWYERKYDGSVTNSNIRYAVRDTAGASVFTPAVLANNGDSPVLNSLTGGKAILTWRSWGGSVGNVTYAVINSNGAITKSATSLTGFEGAPQPDAVLLPNGKVAIAWTADTGVRFAILNSSYALESGPTSAGSSSPTDGYDLSVTTDSASRVIMTWVDEMGQNLFYALGDSTGAFITQPMLYKTSAVYIDTSNNGQGNVPYAATTYNLTVSKSGTGSGTVISSPTGINCGSTCSYAFAYNKVITLTAAPISPSIFGGWSGGGCSGTGTCIVTMSSAQSVTAVFNPPGNQTLTVNKSGTGSGTVTSSPTGINCGSTCSYDFAYNTVVTLTAVPTSPSTFGGWSGGGCSGTGTCIVSMSSAQSVTANYEVSMGSSWYGSVSITSDKNVVAVGRPHVGDEVASYDGFASGSLTAYVPMLFKTAWGSYDSALYIQDVSTDPANVTIKFYDSAGVLTCTKSDTISALSSKGYWLPSEPESCLPTGWVGGAVVTSTKPIVAVGRPHVGGQVMTYNGFTAGSKSMYLPMLFKNAYGSYNSAFYIQNVNTTNTANITIKYYDSAGSLLCTKSDMVAPLASKGYWAPSETCIPDGWVGGVVVTSDQDIVAIGRPHIGSQVTTYNGFAGGGSNMYVPMLFKNAYGGSYDSALYIQNVHASAPATVTIKYYDSAGALSCTKTDTIESLASKGYWIPSETCLPIGWVGGAIITSTQPIAAIGRPHLGAEVTTYNGFSGGSLNSFVPMLFKKMWGTYDSAFYVQNTDAANPASVTVKFYDVDGNLSCVRSDSIPALSTKGYWVPSVICE